MYHLNGVQFQNLLIADYKIKIYSSFFCSSLTLYEIVLFYVHTCIFLNRIYSKEKQNILTVTNLFTDMMISAFGIQNEQVNHQSTIISITLLSDAQMEILIKR